MFARSFARSGEQALTRARCTQTVADVFHHWATLVSRSPRRDGSRSPTPEPAAFGSHTPDGVSRPQPVALTGPQPAVETLSPDALKERARALGISPEALAEAEAAGPEAMIALIKKAEAGPDSARRAELEALSPDDLRARALAAGIPADKIDELMRGPPGMSAEALMKMIEEAEGPAALMVGSDGRSSPYGGSPRASHGTGMTPPSSRSSSRANSPVRTGRSPDGQPVGSRSGSPATSHSGRPGSPDYSSVRSGTPGNQADREPKKEELQKEVEGRLGRKMEAKVAELQMAEDIRMLKDKVFHMEENAEGIMDSSSDLEELRAQLARFEGEVNTIKTTVDAVGRAATEAAKQAAEANAGLATAQETLQQTDLTQLESELKALADLKPALTKLEGAFGSAAAEWNTAREDFSNRLEPLGSVPKSLKDLFDEVGRKVDGAELGKMQMMLEDLNKQVVDVQTQSVQAAEKAVSSGLPQDALDALKDLSEMKDMRGTMNEHAKKLADLFNKKASIDDINQATAMMKELDSKLASEVDTRASSIMQEMGQTRSEWQAKLDSIGRTIDEKADESWMKTLEDQIRAEMEALRKKAGGKGISNKALEAKLAELRQKIHEAGGLHEAGAAVFRCIACDRPLPNVGDATRQPGVPAATGGGQIGGPDRKRGLKENHAEVIMKGGFPMTNPKVSAKDRSGNGPAFGKGGASAGTPALRGDGGTGARPKTLPPLTPPGSAGGKRRVAHDGGYGQGDGEWPPPSLPHSDGFGQRVTTPEAGATRGS